MQPGQDQGFQPKNIVSTAVNVEEILPLSQGSQPYGLDRSLFDMRPDMYEILTGVERRLCAGAGWLWLFKAFAVGVLGALRTLNSNHEGYRSVLSIQRP